MFALWLNLAASYAPVKSWHGYQFFDGQPAPSARATQPARGTTAVASSSILPGLSSRSDTKIMLIAG